MSILVIAEHNNYELNIITQHVVSAACALNLDVIILVIGFNCKNVAQSAANIFGVKEVWVADHQCYADQLAINHCELIVALSDDFNYIMAPASIYGKDLLPRVAAKLDVAQLSDITKIISHDTFERPIYAGDAYEIVCMLDQKKILTIRPTAFLCAKLVENNCPIKIINVVYPATSTQRITYTPTISHRPALSNAKIIVAGGRGLKNSDNFILIEQLADKLGAAVGASRAAVDAGFVDNIHQIGQTGQVVAPDLYIAIGISGAIQHIAGIKDAKIIVAINQDEHAPIFQVADYGIVGDLFEIVPQIINVLSA
jgi:electron transfer flavoprotein alpha subunit